MMIKIPETTTIFTEAKATEIAAANNEGAEVNEEYRVEPKFHGFIVSLYEDGEFIGNF